MKADLQALNVQLKAFYESAKALMIYIILPAEWGGSNVDAMPARAPPIPGVTVLWDGSQPAASQGQSSPTLALEAHASRNT